MMDNEEVIEFLDTLIRDNTESFVSTAVTDRFKAASWLQVIENSSILLAGVGGIGSWTALMLARMNPRNLIIMDPDRVETVNMSGQLYNKNDVGKYKVDALSETLQNYANYYRIMSLRTRFDEESEPYKIMVCGFDNMVARKTYFKKWLEVVKKVPEEERYTCVFIDGRLNAEKFQVFSIVGDDYANMKRYAKDFLFEDSEVEEQLCSYKQTTYCAAMIGAFICNALVNFACNSIARPVVFFQEYDAETLFLKQES